MKKIQTNRRLTNYFLVGTGVSILVIFLALILLQFISLRRFEALIAQLPEADGCEMEYYWSDESGHREHIQIELSQDRAEVIDLLRSELSFFSARISDELWKPSEYHRCLWIAVYGMDSPYFLEVQIPLDRPQKAIVLSYRDGFYVKGGKELLAGMEHWLKSG